MTAGKYKYREVLLDKRLNFEHSAGYELVIKAKPRGFISGILYRWYLINPYDLSAEMTVDKAGYTNTIMLYPKYSTNIKAHVACFLMDAGMAQIEIRGSELNAKSFDFSFAIQRIST